MAVPLFAFVFVILAGLTYRLSRIGRRPAGYPPGPPTLPLIGNLHLMPKEKPHLQFQKWAEEYGPIYSLILGTKVMIVLNTDQAVKDLLDKRSGIYSSRPEMYIGQVVSGGLRILLMEYGSQWRMLRKIIHNSLNIKAAKAYIPYQDLENKAMLIGLLETPDKWADHIRRYSNSLTTQMIFGFRTTSIDDPKLKQLYEGVHAFSLATSRATASLLDLFPILRLLPDTLLPLRAWAKSLHKTEAALYIGHWLRVKNLIRAGKGQPCFSADLLKAQNELGFGDDLAGYVSGSLLEAGSDTTAATLVGFIQALLLHPTLAPKLQTQLDLTCGPHLPTLSHAPSLPLIHSCIKESLRWMPTAILGIPHAATQPDSYLGYTIPKGAGVIYNVWSIHMDPARHPNPTLFNPDRYKNDVQTAAEAANNADPALRDHFGFGVGRRVCQGMHIAERSLFLAIARVLWAFDVVPFVEEEGGRDGVPRMGDLTEGLLVQPKPFKARFVPRSRERVDVLRREWEGVEGLLDEEGQWRGVPEGLGGKNGN
ncbi:cytochrome P450 [Plenodomus tracheiphilus IPT5]|uniref:Cytochrome P450 n=1 Tax=Plenodomus tracheiphilus IPT5 TaxID=1408161 RepID=A0A6A7BAG6_9PLEO|nr:cytochrome P450 [Plenodomus tracheiphilus IPT5]